jgi:small subunit ribosomal protein S8
MKVTDSVGDYLTRIRNALQAGHKVVEIPASKLKKNITKVLHEKGYILSYKFDDSRGPQGVVKIALKYDPDTKQPAIRHIQRYSKPGLRQYVTKDEIPRVLNGLGIAIISTSRGVMSDKEARKDSIGGEVLCQVY